AFKELPKAKYAAELDPPKLIYLVVGIMAGTSKKPQATFGIQYVDDASRSRPVSAGEPKRLLELSSFMSDGLFIDLSSLFDRLGVPLAEKAAEEEFYKMFPDVRRIQRG